jgi:hypothetical protein
VFRVVGLITPFIVVVAGAAEATFDAKEFHSVWDGVWWATVTVTTTASPPSVMPTKVKWDGSRAFVSTDDAPRVRIPCGWEITALLPELDALPPGSSSTTS